MIKEIDSRIDYEKDMLNQDIFKHVLHIGPNYIRHKGGMGAVIATYQKHIPNFSFIPSYEGNYNSAMNIPFFAKSFFKIFFRLLSRQEIKVIHIHGASFGSFYRKYLIFLIGKFIFKKKIIYHLHAAEYDTFFSEADFITRRMITHLINYSDNIIVLSQSWERFIKNTFKPKVVNILNNPIEIPEQTPRSSINPVPISFLFLGRLGERKGIFDLLSVICERKHYYEGKIKLKIGGDGEVNKVKSFIWDNGLEEIVSYVGWVDGKLKDELLTDCDALILPSYNEGLPIAILEAMSYRKAIIASNVGGIPEVVKDGINGYLINPGDKAAIGLGIENLISDAHKLELMGKASLEIASNYDIHQVVKQMVGIYKKLNN